jgi:hypothetical protein
MSGSGGTAQYQTVLYRVDITTGVVEATQRIPGRPMATNSTTKKEDRTFVLGPDGAAWFLTYEYNPVRPFTSTNPPREKLFHVSTSDPSITFEQLAVHDVSSSGIAVDDGIVINPNDPGLRLYFQGHTLYLHGIAKLRSIGNLF